MEKVNRSDINIINRYLNDLNQSNPRPNKEMDLNEVAKLMRRVGFEGPINTKRGPVKRFTHDLLKSHLTGGSFTIHIIHGKRKELIRYLDFKKYMLPNIRDVLSSLEEKGLIKEDE
jgi:hypothetical protein